ncbi:MAG: hypothetical protein ACRYFV_01670 [Janthinobacterium lividum]
MPYRLTLASTAPFQDLIVDVPTSWADVPLSVFLDVVAPLPDDSRMQAETLCGLPAGTLDALAAQDAVYLQNLLAFSQDASDVLAQLPTPGLPDIGTLPYGQLMMAQSYLEQNPDRPALAYGPYLCALYRTYLTWGKFDEAKVSACLAALLASPVLDVYADCSFFLNSYRQLRSGTPRTPTTTKTPKTKRLTQAASRLVKGSDRFSVWMRRLAAAS